MVQGDKVILITFGDQDGVELNCVPTLIKHLGCPSHPIHDRIPSQTAETVPNLIFLFMGTNFSS